MSYKDWATLFRVNTYGCLVIAGICVAKGWGVYALRLFVGGGGE